MNTRAIVYSALLTSFALVPAHAQPNLPSDNRPAVATDSHELQVPGGAQHIYIVTDKPMYRPGETAWFRAWDVQVKDFQQTRQLESVTFELVDPKGAVAAKKKVRVQNGVATNHIDLPVDTVGGTYTLRATTNTGTRGQRAVTVSTYELPRIKKQLDFARASYGPGERVFAELSLRKATGEPLARARATATVWLDGAEVSRLTVRTDRQGLATVRFRLPARIARGQGFLTVMIDGGGVTESIQRRIPIAVQSLSVGLYPEGGDLVTGLQSRVYFRAIDPFGEPVDIAGSVVDSQGRKVTDIRAFARGMGRFMLTPAAGERYRVAISSPKNIAQTFPLPAARADGCVLRTEDDFRSQKPTIGLAVACTQTRDIIATAVLREALIGRVDTQVTTDRPARINVPVPDDRHGAVRVTVFSSDRKPLAERLVFRGWGRHVQIRLRADRDSYSPRDKVELSVETRDAEGKPVAADIALAVVDDTVLNLADDKGANILAALYLQSEMPGQKIREPNFYFSADERAAQALEHLLATQGWRRFNWVWKARK